jgi:hypothetical protein
LYRYAADHLKTNWASLSKPEKEAWEEGPPAGGSGEWQGGGPHGSLPSNAPAAPPREQQQPQKHHKRGGKT